ncbi:MAG: hypothetical protein C4297_06795 [Gemmataceae bacterium]
MTTRDIFDPTQRTIGRSQLHRQVPGDTQRLPTSGRKGGFIVLTVVCLVALFGFVALAVDLGLVAVARTQCQNVADAAAVAAGRALNGDVANDNNASAAAPAALAIATANAILGEPVRPEQVQVSLGSYTYDDTQGKFIQRIPKLSNESWTLARVRVAATQPTYFARILGINSFDVAASATAVHRPRDVAVILDFSGSMRFDSLLGIPYYGARTMSNNPEPVYPRFGHYADAASKLYNPNPFTTIAGLVYGAANVTVSTNSGPAIVNDFYRNSAGSSPIPAFYPAPDSYETVPGGDNYKFKYGSTTVYAKTVQEITNATNSQIAAKTDPPMPGYSNFQGYTLGPRYWGKTFFIWPPDPDPAKDWRRKFFIDPSTGQGVDDNRRLWDTSGTWKPPRAGSTENYRINYAAILQWIKKTGPDPFPPRLRAGRILYYDAIPDTIDTGTFPPADPNQRFWKDYIDYVLGLYQASATTWQVIVPYTGYGDDFVWGSVRISGPYGPYSTAPTWRVHPQDNPRRPLLHFWFGPMTLIDFLGNYNLGPVAAPNYRKHWWWPGTCHESPLWQLKVGIQSAIRDIENNHPNDYVSLILFSSPQNGPDTPIHGRFNRVRAPLGRNYRRIVDALFYPPSTLDNPGTELRPYDYGPMLEAPRAMGATTPVMGFMLAYNQFSANPSLRTYAPSPSPVGEAGGFGRKGAAKLVILETDGMANTPAYADFVNLGPHMSYYRVRQPGEYPAQSGAVETQIYQVVDQLVALESAPSPGYSTKRKPVIIHCLAFGTLFEPYTTTPEKDQALELLQNIQYRGKTQSHPTDPLPEYKRIVGTPEERIQKLQEAFRRIMQDGVQVTLIE